MRRSLAVLCLLACLLAIASAQRRPQRRNKCIARPLRLPTHEFLCSKLGEHSFVEKEILCSKGKKNQCDKKRSNFIQKLIIQTVTTGSPSACVHNPPACDCSKEFEEAQKVYFILTELYRIYPDRFWCLVELHLQNRAAVANIPQVRAAMQAVQFKCPNIPDNYEATLQNQGLLSAIPQSEKCPIRF